jgi:ABC-2 type transport system ATP-binding protein
LTLQLNHLSRSYGDHRVVDDLSLTIPSGQIFGLLGPNGAGKTTTLSIVCGLVASDSGEVLLDGSPLNAADPQQRRLFGVVPQELAIYPDLTARENLDFFGSLTGLPAHELSQRIDHVLEQVGLTEHANQFAGTFSGGMKRRLNFAVGILHDPRIVILDEPTVGVDPQSRSRLLDVVRELVQEDRVVVYCSHYMEEVEALCRRVAIMDHGRLVVCDELDSLLGRISASATVDVGAWSPGIEIRLAELIASGVVVVTPLTPDHLPDGRRLLIQSTGRSDVSGTTSSSVDRIAEFLGPMLANVLSLLTEERIPISHVETHDASLERLFLELTGRKLRD